MSDCAPSQPSELAPSVTGRSSSPSHCSALVALKELREAISDFKGHGMPGFTDRALAYIVMAQADEVLKREMPNDGTHRREAAVGDNNQTRTVAAASRSVQ